MDNRKLILKFLSENLSIKEKDIFEEKMKSDNIFKEQYQILKSALADLKKSKYVKVEDSYFINLVPSIRLNFSMKVKLSFKPALSILSTLAIAVLVVMLIGRNSNQQKQENEILLSELTEQEINYLSDISPEELIDEAVAQKLDDNLSDLLTNELEITGEELALIYNDFETISSNISEDEAGIIYAELINKNIFQ